MLYQSVEHLIAPTPIHYDQAIGIARVGLTVNLACVWLLRDGHDRHVRFNHHHALNLRSAYVHVTADAETSVLAIFALIGGKLWGASWLDPVMGIVGAGLVTVWAYGLLRDSMRVLLDADMDAPVVQEISGTPGLRPGFIIKSLGKEVIEVSPTTSHICDLHVWRVGKGKYACILSLITNDAIETEYFKQLLRNHEELVHITVEVNHKSELGLR